MAILEPTSAALHLKIPLGTQTFTTRSLTTEQYDEPTDYVA